MFVLFFKLIQNPNSNNSTNIKNRICIVLYSKIDHLAASRDVFDGELQDIEFRVAIARGKKDCFYQLAKVDHFLEISFQVVDSKLNWMYPLADNSDMRISFELFDPYNRPIVRKERSNADTHVHTVKEPGVYAFCFDNSHSISTKIINLELYLYSNQDDDRWGSVDPTIKFEEELTKYSDSVEILKVQQ